MAPCEKKVGAVGAMPPGPLEMTHVGQVRNIQVGRSNNILNSMGRGGPEWGGGGLVSSLIRKHPVSSTRHCRRALWRCMTGVVVPIAPWQSGSALQEF